MNAQTCVLDASVGAKWFRDEAGSGEAWDLVARHTRGEIVIAVDTLFEYEVLRVASRDGDATSVIRAWDDLKAVGLVTVPLGDELVSAAAAVRSVTGCALYDAFSAGLAELLEAPLYSADARAHGSHPRVRLVGA